MKSLFDEKLKTYQKIDKETKRKFKAGISSDNTSPDSDIADVLQMLDYKIEYDNDGNEKSRKLQQTVRNFEIIMDNDSRFAGKIKFDEFSRQEYLMGEIRGKAKPATEHGEVMMMQRCILSYRQIMELKTGMIILMPLRMYQCVISSTQ